uniref:peptidylprolyl isomerase n=1 Tax=Oryza punctata TaxID=4537 RepID=A0A0E0M3E0_ORYPU
MELSIAPAAMAMGRLAKNPKMINHRYASELRLQHCLSPACSVMFNKHCSYRITRKSCSVLQAVSPIRVTVAGTMTESFFDKVFSNNVAAAQPLPGFRRMKGDRTGRTCGYVSVFCSCIHHTLEFFLQIPKEIALHIIGPSKVKKETIKNIISFTIAEYVQKEGLDASKNLKVLQSYEELEAAFEPGKEFCFDATLRLQ